VTAGSDTAGPGHGGTIRRRALAWAVHAYTATGLVLGAVAAVLIVQGRPDDLRLALICFLAATVLDSTDGFLARRARVAEVLPEFDGRRLDDIIDYQLYTSLPLLLVWRTGALPGATAWVLLLPLLASAYGFAQRNAKTEDGWFLGFPSYWNVVAFYIWALMPPPAVTVATLGALALLTFVPVRYLYPSMGGSLNRITAVLGALWAMAILLILLDPARPARPLVLASLAVPAWYMGASWVATLRHHRRGAVL
jgi:phosphatidylcholine synthase